MGMYIAVACTFPFQISECFDPVKEFIKAFVFFSCLGEDSCCVPGMSVKVIRYFIKFTVHSEGKSFVTEIFSKGEVNQAVVSALYKQHGDVIIRQK